MMGDPGNVRLNAALPHIATRRSVSDQRRRISETVYLDTEER